MYLTPDIALQHRLMRWSKYLAIAVMGVASLVLIGWEFDIAVFKAPVGHSVSMNPVTAINFILLSASILIFFKKDKTFTVTGFVLVGIIFTIALIKLLAVNSILDLHIDTVLFKEKVQAIQTGVTPSNIAPYTAICFLLMSVSLFIVNKAKGKMLPGQLPLLIVGLIGLLFLLGYIYQLTVFNGVLNFTPMAIHTAACFILSAAAVLFALADKGLMRQLTSVLTGSVIARSLIPAAIFIPALLGFLRLYGNKIGLYSNEFGIAVFSTAITAVFFILIWYNTILLNRRDIVKAVTAKELEKSIEQNAYLASLLNNTSDAVFSMDQNFIIKSWNRAAEEIYGTAAADAIGKYTMDVIKTKISPQDRAVIRAGLAKRGYATTEVIQYSKTGKLLEMLSSTTATKNAAGDTIGYISICHDISERRKLETQLKQTNAELEAFTYSVSHDLRAPLRGIIGFTAILEEEYANKLDDEARRITGVIKGNALRMGNLIDDLLNFSRLGRNSINKTSIDTIAMINQVIAELDTKDNKNQIEWIIHPLPEINGDINTIRQVWVNLLSNAAKYSRNNMSPVIEIGVMEKNGEEVFFVKDNGVGFDQQYSDKLFKVFQRLHSHSEFEGTGVGLALVEKIISRHGGRIWAEAELNKGATFYFTFENKSENNI